MSAQQQRGIIEKGANVLLPVVTVRINGTEVGRLVGAEMWGGPGALV